MKVQDIMNRDVHICRPETNLAMAAPTTFPFAGVELSRPSEIPRAAAQLPFTFEDVSSNIFRTACPTAAGWSSPQLTTKPVS